MPKDRLADLKQLAPTDNSQLRDGSLVDIPQEDEMGKFFAQIEELQRHINKISENIEKVAEQHSQKLSSVTAQQGKKSDRELDELMAEIQSSANTVRRTLKQMDKDNKSIDESERHKTSYRMRTQQHVTVSRKFIDVMNHYNEVQSKYKQKYSDMVRRQMKIVKEDATDAEVEEILASEQGGSIFAKQILTPEHAEAKQQLDEIKDRHEEIIKLEKAIRELHELFVDMAILVEQQGEMIDRIEYNVSEGSEYVEEAVRQLKSAVVYQSAARKKKVFLIVLILVILIAVALILYFLLRK